MWPFRSNPKPSPKRLAELEEDISDVKIALAWCKKAIVDLNARMATVTRQVRAAEKSEEDGSTVGVHPEGELDAPAPRSVPRYQPTAFLARRFKGG